MEGSRREFLRTASGALAGGMASQVQGANDRIALGFIGLGVMGQVNLYLAMRHAGVHVAALCDVYEQNLENAAAITAKRGLHPKLVHDFRDVLADRSIDAVCISTPDHWHALMTVEACKAGKDVYVEKPVCAFVDEAPLMVAAARRYQRVVQGGNQSRSSGHMEAVRKLIAEGTLGQVTFVRAWDYSLEPRQGIGDPPDSAPFRGLDWDLWTGPAPLRAFSQNRFQVQRGSYSAYRYYWDYAGGALTDRGVHLIDLVQMAFGETAPTSAMSIGAKTYLQDSRETPDTQLCLYEYPQFLLSYENRYGNSQSMFGRSSGILVCGSKGTLCFGRQPAYQFYSEREPASAPVNPPGTFPPVPGERFALLGFFGGDGSEESEPVIQAAMAGAGPAAAPAAAVNTSLQARQSHWADFLDCVRTRRKPVGDIEYTARSAVTGLLGNIAFRSRIRVDYDPAHWSSPQSQARELMAYRYRAPWRLEV